MGFPKFMLDESQDKKKQIIIIQYNNTKKNQNEINIKVDYMTMAQEYFKRAIVVVATFSIIVFLNYIVNFKPIVKSSINAIISMNVNQIILIGMLISLIILFVLVAILVKKIKSLEKGMRNTES